MGVQVCDVDMCGWVSALTSSRPDEGIAETGTPSRLFGIPAAAGSAVGEFVYAVTAAEGIILSLFMSNEQRR